MILGLTTGMLIMIGFLLLISLLIAGISAGIFVYRLKNNFIYEVLENNAGTGYVQTKRGRCRRIQFGDGGEEVFYLPRLKKWRIAYGKRTGRNKITWVIGDDDYWYNVTFGDLDKKRYELGSTPVTKDMRLGYASVRKGIDRNYKKTDFMEKYGTIIAFGMLFLCIIAFGGILYYVFTQQGKIATANAGTMETSKEVMETAKEVLTKIDLIRSGGNSGYIPVNPTT